MEKKNYCDWCFRTFGSTEPRRHRIVGNTDGGLEEESYHIPCFHLLELKELILETAKRNEKISHTKCHKTF